MTQKWSCSRTHCKLAYSLGRSLRSSGRQQGIVFLQRLHHLLGGRFNFASRRPLYSTCSMNLSGGWPLARMRAAAPGVMRRQRRQDLGFEFPRLEVPLLQLG